MNVHVYMGVMGSGKDYQASKIKRATKVSFADELREDVWKMLGWRPSSEKDYESFKSSVIVMPLFEPRLRGGRNACEERISYIHEFTGRELLQRYGTQVRRAEDDNIWATRTRDSIINLYKDGVKDVVVTDCRFPNEVESMKLLAVQPGFNVKFYFCNYESEKYSLEPNHESEYLSIALVKLHDGNVFTKESFHEFIMENDWVGSVLNKELKKFINLETTIQQ